MINTIQKLSQTLRVKASNGLKNLGEFTKPNPLKPQSTVLNKLLLIGEGLGVAYLLIVSAAQRTNLAIAIPGLGVAGLVSVDAMGRGKRIENAVEADLEREFVAQDARIFGVNNPPETIATEAGNLGVNSAKDVLNRLVKLRNENPFVLIGAPQGSGKTTLATYLSALSRLAGNETVVITPHISNGDWRGASKVVVPKNPQRMFLDMNENPSLRLLDMPTDCTYMQALYSLKYEFNYRLQNGLIASEHPELPLIDVFIDEAPALYSVIGKAKNLKNYLADTGLLESHFWDVEKDTVDTKVLNNETTRLESVWSKGLILDGMTQWRKYGLRVFLIGQVETVGVLGMQGLSNLRDNSTKVDLGRYCLQHLTGSLRAKQKQNNHTYLTVDGEPYETLDPDFMTLVAYKVAEKFQPLRVELPPTPAPGDAQPVLEFKTPEDELREVVLRLSSEGVKGTKLIRHPEVKQLAKDYRGIPKANNKANDSARKDWITGLE